MRVVTDQALEGVNRSKPTLFIHIGRENDNIHRSDRSKTNKGGSHEAQSGEEGHGDNYSQSEGEGEITGTIIRNRRSRINIAAETNASMSCFEESGGSEGEESNLPFDEDSEGGGWLEAILEDLRDQNLAELEKHCKRPLAMAMKTG